MPTPRDAQHAKVLIDGVESTARLLGLTLPTYDGTSILTPDQAGQAQRAVEEWFTTHGYEQHEMPALYQPGHEGAMWVLSLEGGPEDWPMQVCEALCDKWPYGVFAEPVTSWCLGLYPA